ncbi:hypothetical protein Ddye_028228 [Dipteronia dyeriana]|uniref:Receptor-like serine/threonine-protein kinase n=1 Tax=Dipteronia dyeriana TaxID=168575 RepID=A0AAD9TRH7_9ROSI|nr:hypothetical protein Ddye_028228 [Dipteronia dyeriana]
MGCFLFLITFVGTLFFSSIMNLSVAVDTISLAQSIKDGETLVSASQSFELGFFTPGNSNNRYLGIWYKFNSSTVVWVANRKNPTTDKQGMLVMSDDGNLVLLSEDKKVIWSTNSSWVLENPVAQLLDSGNLVIKDNINMNPDSYVWQSFDYPSDILLPGMKLGWNLRTGFERYLTPWRSADDPSPGDFSLRLDIDELPQLVITTGSRKEVRSGPWNGRQFGGTPFSDKVVHNFIFKAMLVHKQDELYYIYEPFNNTVKTHIVLHQSGTMHRLVWNWNTTEWSILYTWPFDPCDNYAQCGANNNCRINKMPICECLKGFIPKAEDEWDTQGLSQSRKCIEKSPYDCLSGEGFLKLPAIKLPDFSWSNNRMNIKECEAECFKNCSCRAYAISDVSRGNGCLMWFGDLIDIRECPPGFGWGQDIFLRVPASELVHYLNKKKRIQIIAVVSTFTGIFIFVLVLCTVWKKTKNRGLESREEEEEVPFIDLSTITAATNNFCQANMIGQGGFGPVYKGNLSTGQEIAVKRLSNNSGQGVEEFKSEVVLIGKLQHRNLVGLLGSCIQRDERMLIYEYMPNKSLDYFIFDDERSKFLSWRKRFDIIIGIARGLLYLHQDSKLQIIHRDLKASNILLDNDLNPKISDFGLARIFKGDDKEANTKRIAGTYGYMSPEYATNGNFSVKSDVFSFGVLLLEIVSGKKNRGFCHADHHLNLLGHAWVLWNNGMALEVKDVRSEDSSFESQVLRCIQVGLLCVQMFPEDRPEMSSVVFMLANEGLLLPQPKQPGFFTQRGFIPGSTSSSKEKYDTENAMSITTQDGR